MKDAVAQHVVYVHGLWMPGGESLLLAHRLLREFGFQVHSFPYSAATLGVEEITARLQRFVRVLSVPAVHFVGHSLGGLIIYRFFEHYPEQPPGRVVFLGSPCLESRAAVQAARLRFVSTLMGPSVADELLRPRDRRWTAGRRLAVARAGSVPRRLPGGVRRHGRSQRDTPPGRNGSHRAARQPHGHVGVA